MSTISTAIETATTGPKSQTTDGQSTTEFAVKELIDADHHVAEQAASNKTALPIRAMKVRSGGPVL